MWTYSQDYATARLANHLSFSKFYSYYEKTKPDNGFNGSTDVSYSMTSPYRACVCICVCVPTLLIKIMHAKGTKGSGRMLANLTQQKISERGLKQRTEQGEGKHRRKVNCHRLHPVSVFGLICCHNGSIRQSAMLTVSAVNGNAACSCVHCWPTVGCYFSKGFTCGQRREMSSSESLSLSLSADMKRCPDVFA